MSDLHLDAFLRRNRGKSALVAWSGGIDSTYLVWRCLRAGMSVGAAYFGLMNNEEKTKRELAAIDRLEPLLRTCAQYPPSLIVMRKAFSITVEKGEPATYMQQVPAWLAGISYVSGGYNVAAIGYVMNDDAVSYVDEIRGVHNAMTKLMHRPAPRLEFPLTRTSKREMLLELPEEIAKECTFCENPGEKDFCGECVPCLKWKYLEERGHVPDALRRFTKPHEAPEIEAPKRKKKRRKK